MRFSLHLLSGMGYESLTWHKSAVAAGVRYAIRRISLGQRIELTRKVRELTHKYEFLRAGDSTDHLEAALGDLLTRRLYIEWGLGALEGLIIDNELATVASVIDRGPEELTGEIVAAIQAELGLSDEERKNS